MTTTPSNEQSLERLTERVKRCRRADNALDVAIEVALFTPDQRHVSARANAAGTKVIYARPDGGTDTHWAFDYTLSADSRALALEALKPSQPSRMHHDQYR